MPERAGVRPSPMPTAAIRGAINKLADDAIVTITRDGDDRTYEVHGFAPLVEIRGDEVIDKLELRIIPVES